MKVFLRFDFLKFEMQPKHLIFQHLLSNGKCYNHAPFLRRLTQRLRNYNTKRRRWPPGMKSSVLFGYKHCRSVKERTKTKPDRSSLVRFASENHEYLNSVFLHARHRPILTCMETDHYTLRAV